MNNKRTYMTYGFLDFLAYYVPGVLLIVFFSVINFILNLNIGNLVTYINELSDDAFVRGAMWTVLSLVVPYVLGHLIFPLGYRLGKRFFNNRLPENVGQKIENCKFVENSSYCEMEDFEFAECLFNCFQSSSSGFNDLMITRFRTLSRFCRSMLFPSFLLILIFFALALYQLIKYRNIWTAIALLIISILTYYSYRGFGNRHKKYEIRWRNGICIGKKISGSGSVSP